MRQSAFFARTEAFPMLIYRHTEFFLGHLTDPSISLSSLSLSLSLSFFFVAIESMGCWQPSSWTDRQTGQSEDGVGKIKRERAKKITEQKEKGANNKTLLHLQRLLSCKLLTAVFYCAIWANSQTARYRLKNFE